MSAATPTDSLLAKLTTSKAIAGGFAGLVAVVLLGFVLRGAEADRDLLRAQLTTQATDNRAVLERIAAGLETLATREEQHAQATRDLAAVAARGRP